MAQLFPSMGRVFKDIPTPNPELAELLEKDKANRGTPEHSQTPDYPTLRKMLNDYTSTFYGPSACEGCGTYDVVRKAFDQGAESWVQREGKGGTVYIPHHCTHVGLFNKLAGRILTVLDASLSTNPKQHKAVCDLIRSSFRDTISRARELEGDRTGESFDGPDQLT